MIPIIHFWHNNTTKNTRDITKAVHLLLLVSPRWKQATEYTRAWLIYLIMGCLQYIAKFYQLRIWEKICQLMRIFSKIKICTLCNGTPKASPASMWDVAGCVWQVYWQVNLPLCSPKNTSLNFLNGFPNSPEELILKCCII